MPDKHPNSARWGGPGASEENAKTPAPKTPGPESDTLADDRNSHVSGGGGVPDHHHNHDPRDK